MDVFARLSRALGGSIGPEQSTSNGEASTSLIGQTSPVKVAKTPRRRVNSDKIGADAFKNNWRAIQAHLVSPDQAALHHGVTRTDLAARLNDLSDALISEANRSDEESDIAGPCMEALLEGDLLGRLVRLTANDRIAGSQALVVKLFATLIILLDERFLSRQAVHRPLVRLMRICVGDEFFNSGLGVPAIEGDNEDEETKAWRRFGRDGSAEALGFEEDLVDMMCHVASRLRNSPELLIIFFRDRGGDAEAKRAFNRALTGAASPQHSLATSRNSTRPTSPAIGPSSNSMASIKSSMPAVSSPLRPSDSLSVPTSPTKREQESASNASTSTSLTYDFPLFSYLLRFVHRESRTGELARAGLLFLVDVAFAPGRRNVVNQSRRKEVNRGPPMTPTRATRGGLKKGGSARIMLESDFGLGPSLALARYMLESDFAEVLAASLGAVYGLLPTKLVITRQENAREGRDGMSLGGNVLPGVEAEPIQSRSIALSTSEEVRKQARLLSDLLEFTQDILRTSSRMPGDVPPDDKKRTYDELIQVAQSLTASIGRSIQTLFLENILYPSLLECSETDGSAVAVMSYVDLVLAVLENDGPLASFIVGWLIGEERQTFIERQEKTKHKSTAMLQLEREKGAKKEASNYFSDAMGRYTVKDLLLDHLKSGVKADASIAALQLASTIVTYYGCYSLHGLLQVEANDAATAFPDSSLANLEESEDNDDSEDFVYPGGSREEVLFEEKLQAMSKRVVKGVSIAQHAQEMSLYLSLARLVEKGDASTKSVEITSTDFDNYLDDAEQGLIRDSMFWDGLFDQQVSNDLASFRHSLISQDAVLKSVLEKLCQFWQNTSEVNVALTGLITDLAVCPMRSLEGFIVFSRASKEDIGEIGPSFYQLDLAMTNDEEDDRSDDEKAFAGKVEPERKRIKTINTGDVKSAPIVMCILRSLVQMLEQYRSEVTDFDRLLQERRRGLLYVEKLNEALKVGDDAGIEQGTTATSRYEPTDDEIGPLWDSIKIDPNMIEVSSSRRLSSRAKRISLPPPPSATIDSSDDNNMTSALPKREGFARFFGRGNTVNPENVKSAVTSVGNGNAPIPQPFAQHYQETSSIFLGIDDLKLSKRSKWSSQYQQPMSISVDKIKGKRTRFKDAGGDSDDDSVIYPGLGEDDDSSGNMSEPHLVSLSALLDNAVILQEFIKQLAAILQVRRSNGIDAIQFV